MPPYVKRVCASKLASCVFCVKWFSFRSFVPLVRSYIRNFTHTLIYVERECVHKRAKNNRDEKIVIERPSTRASYLFKTSKTNCPPKKKPSMIWCRYYTVWFCALTDSINDKLNFFLTNINVFHSILSAVDSRNKNSKKKT